MFLDTGGRLTNSDVIYQRASWAWWSGGRIFTDRQMGSAVGLTVINVTVEDPLPTFEAFHFDLRSTCTAQSPARDRAAEAAAARAAGKLGDFELAAWAAADPAKGAAALRPAAAAAPHASSHGATLSNAHLENIRVANFSTMRVCGHPACGCVPACAWHGAMPFGLPNLIVAGPDPRFNISGLRFVNVTMAGVPLSEAIRTAAFNLTVGPTVAGVTVDGVPVAELLRPRWQVW